MTDKPQENSKPELPELDADDFVETQDVSEEFEYEDDMNLISELDTRPALPGRVIRPSRRLVRGVMVALFIGSLVSANLAVAHFVEHLA